ISLAHKPSQLAIGCFALERDCCWLARKPIPLARDCFRLARKPDSLARNRQMLARKPFRLAAHGFPLARRSCPLARARWPLAPRPPPAAVGPVLPAAGALSYSDARTCPAARRAAARWNAKAGRGCAGQLSHGPRRHVMSQNLIDLSLDAERLGRL